MVKNKEHLFFAMDNEPSQRSSKANEALHEIGADLVEIPPRSPDLNPIEKYSIVLDVVEEKGY